MVHHNRRIVAERATRVPVQRAQLHGVSRGRGGGSPGAVHGAVALRQLADHVHTQDVLVVDACAVSQTVHLLEKVVASEGRGDVGGPVQRHIQPHLGHPVAQPRRQELQLLLSLGVQVLHGAVDHGLRLGLHHGAVGVSHLVRGSVHVDDPELKTALAVQVRLSQGESTIVQPTKDTSVRRTRAYEGHERQPHGASRHTNHQGTHTFPFVAVRCCGGQTKHSQATELVKITQSPWLVTHAIRKHRHSVGGRWLHAPKMLPAR